MLRFKVDGIAESSAPRTAPTLPYATEPIEQLRICAKEVKRPPIVVLAGSRAGDRVRMFTAKVPLVELGLLFDRAIARGQLEIGVVLLTDLE